MSEQASSGREIRQNSSNKQSRSDITVKPVPSATSFHNKKGVGREGGRYGDKFTPLDTEKSAKGSDKPPTLLKRQNKSSSSSLQSSGQNSKVENRESAESMHTKSKNDSLNFEKKSSKIDDRSSGNGIEVRTLSSSRKSSSSRPGSGGSGKPRVINSSSRSARTFTSSDKYRGSSNNSISSDVAESYRLRIPDVTLCQLLGDIAEDSRGTNSHIQDLNNYLVTNTKSILRAGQNLWDSLLELLAKSGQSGSQQPPALLVSSLAKVGLQSSIPTHQGEYYDTRFIEWLLTNFESSNESTQISLMSALDEMFESNKLHFNASQIQNVMSKMLTLFEAAENGKVLAAILKLFLHFSKQEQDSFSHYFVDVVDILIGWYMELSQSDELINQIIDALGELHRYWRVNSQYCYTLTGHFIEDLESYCHDVSELDDNDSEIDVLIEKSVLLLRIFKTVVEATGTDVFSYTQIDRQLISKYLCQILSCHAKLSERRDSSDLSLAVNEIIVAVKLAYEDLSFHEPLIAYTKSLIGDIHESSYPLQISSLNVLVKLFSECEAAKMSAVHEAFVAQNLSSLKLSDSIQVQKALIQVYHTLFNIKDMKVIQTTYQQVKEGIDSSLQVITGEVTIDWADTRADITHYKESAAELIVFNLTLLTHVATDTSNLILMYALEPSIFGLLVKEIVLDYGDYIKSYPSLLLAVLKLAHRHCTSNKNFIAKSSLLAVETKRPKLLQHITVNKNNADSFALIMESMSYVLSICKGNPKAQILMSKWFEEILQQLAAYNSPLFKNELVMNAFKHLIQLDDTEYVELSLLNISKCMNTLLRSGYVDDIMLASILDFALYQLSSESDEVRKAYLTTLSLFPVTDSHRIELEDTAKKCTQVQYRRKAIMAGVYGSLTAENFKSFAALLFKHFTDFDDPDQSMLQRLLITAEKPSASIDHIIHHNGLLEYWCLWQAADFCVAHRLRTPIGKPADTFMCIEAAIKQIAADKKVEVTPKSGANKKRVWLLLQFMENLEKVLYNAYEGTAGQITTHNKMVKTFFRTNKGTCVEWLTRIRLHIVSIASVFSHPTTVIRHGYELINDMVKNKSTQMPEFELVLIYLTEAWTQLNCHEAIQGLYEWCKTTCNKKYPWIKAASLKAMQKYEQAAIELKTSLKTSISPQTHLATSSESIQLQTRPTQVLPAVIQFCAQQVTNCYTTLQTWKEASQWLNEIKDMKTEDSSAIGEIDPITDGDKLLLEDYIEELNTELMSWSVDQHLTKLWRKSVRSPASSLTLLSREDKSNLEKLFLLQASSDWPPALHSDTMLTFQSQLLLETKSSLTIRQEISSSNLNWLLNLKQASSALNCSADSVQRIELACCQEARHTSNLALASRLVSSLPQVSAAAGSVAQMLRVERETAKLDMARGDQERALHKMINIVSRTKGDGEAVVSELIARSTLTVVKWLQTDSKYYNQLSDSGLLESLVRRNGGLITDSNFVPANEQMLGSMLHLSTTQCASLAKTWLMYGNWAYKWGRKCLDNANQSLSIEEIQHIDILLPTDIQAAEREDVITIMSSVQGSFTPADDDMTDESPDYIDDDRMEIKKRLMLSAPSLSDQTLDGLIELWACSAKKVYHLYEESAKSYFNYLNMNNSTQTSGYQNVTVTLRLLRLLVKHAWELRSVLEDGLKKTPTSPWKSIIPQLFSRLNHPEVYVRQSVSDLLARLAEEFPHLIIYPAMVGRKQSSQNNTALSYVERSADMENRAEASGDGVTQSDSKTGLADCFNHLVDTLSASNPQLIQQVDTIITELCRITVLWDELWLGSLGQLSNTAAERIKSLASEVERVKTNKSLTPAERSSLIQQKRDTIALPLIHALERLDEITRCPAETKHEQWFQDTYGYLIKNGLEKLRNPDKPEDLLNDWQPFKQLHTQLVQRSQKRASHMLKMKDVSNTLSKLADTYIPLPGIIAKGTKHPVTLKSVVHSIQILPTKTKPKKLAFIGSDGQKYMYLFKGLEDLHLDERIMQLLNIVNDMLESKTNNSDALQYRARNYAVTPLGLRSGLIQWVDGCVPLFSLYKRWQVREAAAVQSKSGNNNTSVQRPSEVFYSKLIPILRQVLDDKSIKDIRDAEKIRKDWPLPAVVTALKQLIAETPSYLVAKELWCSSTSSNEWWTMSQTYCRSVAVMSVIGYILGLGDRHLDNLLLDVNNGEVVHIDYNVCFDKGKSLRVPERVPFRLTQNIVSALGATGIEGIFRAACEHTIKSMRLGKETLLTLLEAFVYDPLVDWTVGGESGLAGAVFGGNYALGTAAKDHRRRKKQMERDITRSMFSIRVTEMRTAWLQNKDDMASSLKEVVSKLTTISDESQNVGKYRHEISLCEKALLYVDQLKHSGPQAVSQVIQRYETNKKYSAVKSECLAELNSFIHELSKYSDLHLAAIEGTGVQPLDRLSDSINKLPQLGSSPSSCTRAFIQTVGQTSILDQMDQYHSQLVLVADTRKSLLSQCIDWLKKYSAVVGKFPAKEYSSNHVMGDCLEVMKNLANDFSLESCMKVKQDLENSPRRSPSKKLMDRVVSNQKCLHSSLKSDNAKLDKVAERSKQETADLNDLAKQYHHRKSAITKYIHDHEDYGFHSVMSVILPKLIEINRRNIMMESAASKAGERLHSLTSREGDWFLDELTCITENILEYINMTSQGYGMSHSVKNDGDHGDELNSEPWSHGLYTVIDGIHKVYIALQDVVQNFQQIILPGVLTSMSRHDKSTSDLLAGFCEIVSRVDWKDTISKLEASLRNVMFGTNKALDVQTAGIIKDMRQRYSALLSADSGDVISDGMMLFMAFDGLFTQVFDQYTVAMSGLSEFSIPKTWRKVDMIGEAGSLQQTQFSEKTRLILEDVFFVRKLKSMSEFFSTAKEYVQAFSDNESGTVESYETLSTPIKVFIAEFVRRNLIGVASQSMGYLLCELFTHLGLDVTKEIELKDFGANSKVSIEDLCKKCIDKEYQLAQTTGHIAQGSNLISNFEQAWRRQDLAKRLDRSQTQLRCLVSHQQHDLTCYQWLHEDTLHKAGESVVSHKKSILTELHKVLTGFTGTTQIFTELLEKLVNSEANIAQRLKWAAGANPQISSIMSTFEKGQAHRAATLQAEGAIAKEIVTACNSILHLESMRAFYSEADGIIQRCGQILARSTDVCKLLQTGEQSSNVEMLMISLLNPSDLNKTGNALLSRAHDCIKSHMASLHSKTKGLNKSIGQLKEKYKSHVTHIHGDVLSDRHYKLMSEVRAVLNTLAKEEMEDAELGTSVQQYLKDYKLFLEKLITLLSAANQQEETTAFDLDKNASVIAGVNDLLGDVDKIFTGLLELAKPLTASSTVENKADSEERNLSGVLSPSQTVPVKLSASASNVVDKPLRDPKTGKAVQERNSYAVSVWRRVKMKLDGRELDPNKKLSVAEQVNYIITEATDIRNLALMYEGWTSWV